MRLKQMLHENSKCKNNEKKLKQKYNLIKRIRVNASFIKKNSNINEFIMLFYLILVSCNLQSVIVTNYLYKTNCDYYQKGK